MIRIFLNYELNLPRAVLGRRIQILPPKNDIGNFSPIKNRFYGKIPLFGRFFGSHISSNGFQRDFFRFYETRNLLTYIPEEIRPSKSQQNCLSANRTRVFQVSKNFLIVRKIIYCTYQMYFHPQSNNSILISPSKNTRKHNQQFKKFSSDFKNVLEHAGLTIWSNGHHQSYFCPRFIL